MAATMSAASMCTALVAPVEIGNASTKASRVLMVSQAPSARVTCSAETQKPVEQSRRGVLSLLAAAAIAGAAATEAKAEEPLSIQIDGPPAPFGGLPGTESADQARDTDAPLKERFYLQSLTPAEAIVRAKESAAQIVAVKGLIEKKAWPYVQNDLRSKAGYLRFDLNTVIGSKPRDEKLKLTKMANELYDSIAALDYAARSKSSDKALASYDTTVKLLNDVLTQAS
eukprot:TRINITY_DN2831_c0_g1_i1.p1 TRINITY_DN2831_c0_g1~~TRINITY_DN2831_c0_g1_i1.p1  ORF type:complete len:227 (+),score=55.29 TRINITY_DN2831_c0_g1_i1:157-837(+)